MTDHLASPYRVVEDVRVLAVVISELKFGNIQREIFAADFVKCSDNAALHQRPKTFDGLRMHRADNVLAFRVVNAGQRIFTGETVVTRPLIGTEQANLSRDGLANELRESAGADVFDHPRYHVAFAAYRSGDWRFTG